MYLQKMKNNLFYQYCSIISSVLFIMLAFILPDFAHAAHAKKRIHSVFFEDTDHELNVYRIYGKEPGNTLLLIGGIQGDEPGGFLSADYYADIGLAKGNLIVVPRANFQSIVLNRRKINEDMNRKFADKYKSNYETKIVAILKKLIAESNCLLNLHDGSGFFSEKWEGPDRNPKRYGQSIIADCESYVNPETGKVLKLGDMARSVCEQINKNIEDPRYRFRFNNHKTIEKRTLHKEQRKSATFYSLYTCGIPAFGIETSKSLQLELKVRHHNLAINAFMELLGIVPETPGINLYDPELKYLIVSVNNDLPVAVKNQQTLNVNSGDTITISHIEANYERGLSADIVGYGTINDIRKDTKIKGSTRIVVRKDYYPCGSVYIALNDSRNSSSQEISVSDALAVSSSFLSYKVKINNNEQICQNYDRLKLIMGDTFEIVDVITAMGDPSDMVVNLKGYVGDKQNNTGEDRGYIINTAEDLWPRYSLDKKEKTYQVVVTYEDKIVGKLFIDLEKP
ncbi:MAG: M14/M99 family metallopeptidase [Desulfobacterales bacterium]|nr:M14/M99 family metallopeptidase [Desulfobacterales bacterium]